MPTNHQSAGLFDPEVRYSALDERVTNLSSRLTHLDQTMTAGFREMQAAIAGLSGSLNESRRPQWQAISVGVAFISVIGFLVYQPITSRLSTVETTSVSRDELDWRSSRGAEDRARNDAAFNDLRSQIIPKAELDQRFENVTDRNADVQRQLEKVVADLGQLYPIKDVFAELQERLSRLEMLRFRQQQDSYTPPQ